MNYPTVSIIFPNYNGGREPLKCLRSIKALNYPQKQLEIIVIDNGSTDGSDVQIKLKYPGVILIKQNKNTGFAKAINLGIKSSLGKYIFIANDDLLFAKNSLKILIEYIRDHPDVGVIGGKIYSQKPKKRLSSTGYMMNRVTGDVYCAPHPAKIGQPDWIQGCAMLVPENIFRVVGFLDENYEHFFEDFDFCLRVKKSRHKVVYLPGAVFWHGESKTADKNLSAKYYHWYKNKIRFILINMPILNIISILLIQIIIVTPYRAIILRDGRLVPFLKALFWNLKYIFQTLKFRTDT